MNNDFIHSKVIPFEDFLTINFNYQDIDILLKGLELFCYNMKNVYLLKEDTNSVREMSYKISILYNLILSSYTLHIDKQLKQKEEKEKNNIKGSYYRFKIDTRQMRRILKNRKEVKKIG